jgi:4-hydroxybenzoate polyprenyltransferase
MLYALQDQDFDRREGLHSIPARFGTVRAIMIARGLHVGAILALAIFGISAHLATLYFLGVATITGLLTWEHRLVTPQDLTRIDAAFFTANGWISMVFFMATLLGLPTPRL